MNGERWSGFAARLRSAEPILASWVKTPHPHVVEVLARSELDALVLDAEHAPFGREALDACILAARATDMPVLVRPAANDAAAILQVLDGGALGVVVPHVRSAKEAAAAVKACRYVPGGRGFAGSTRAAGYTTRGMAAHRATSGEPLVIAQVEDAEALHDLPAICSTDGLDGVFVGRADLTVSLEAATPDDEGVIAAVEAICAAATNAGLPVGMFLGRTGDTAMWRERGASFFFLQSDQEFLLAGARRLVESVEL
ncbi:HpcH/HpaI aldolase family protein [Erythrobacter sp.]|jgi:2-keto-3-deoxy-L-rhamnonate aldolase RhmA|uniref:HpcH/HpaI aldolase family protein n=1 Tax=Erythrobacter sp. TaxID=1042 RepID=UPI002EA004EC|nr:aldolase/citrate lyase family protein [Erythrobacter sp.]